MNVLRRMNRAWADVPDEGPVGFAKGIATLVIVLVGVQLAVLVVSLVGKVVTPW